MTTGIAGTARKSTLTSKSPAAPGLALLIPLAALAGADVQAQGRDQRLTIDGTVNGEITSASRLNFNDGSRSAAFDIRLAKDDMVGFAASGPLCATLTLLHENLVVAGPVQRSCGDIDAPAVELVLRAPSASTYQIVVSGQSGQSFGPFQLAAKRITGFQGDTLKPGDSIEDWRVDQDRRFHLDIAEEGLYVINMRSAVLDSRLELTGSGVSATDDDGGEGLDSRMQTLLRPGRYQLLAGTTGGTGSGLYRLAIERRAISGDVDTAGGRALEPGGSPLTGMLTAGSLDYPLTITQRSRVNIDLTSSDFDALLDLTGPDTTLRDDDGGGGTDARIGTVLEPGSYTVRASSLDGSGTGLFTLNVTATPAAAGVGGGDLALGGSSTGDLPAGAKDRYRLVIPSDGRYVIEMTASGLDSYLQLLADGNEVASDDDSGGNNNARIVTDLKRGRYQIVASAFGGGSGSYQISARRE